MMELDRRHALVAILVVLTAVGAVGAQSYLLTAGGDGTFDHEGGVAVTLDDDYYISGDNPFNPDGSVTIRNTTVDGPEGSHVRIAHPYGNYPTISAIDTNGGTVEANTTNIQTVGVSGSITSLSYRDVDLQDDTTTEFEVSGSGTLYVHGFGAGESLRANRADGDDELVQADSSGVAAITVTDGADLTLVEDAGGPTLSNPSPTGGEQFSTTSVNLSVDVTDPDFDTANEEVTLEWYVDGSLQDTTTVSTGQTATYEASVTDSGEHEWYVEASDTTGETAASGSDSDPHTFQTPGTLYVRDESNPESLIDTETVEIRFYFEDDPDALIVNRSASDGTVDMTGLPTDRPFVVVAEADGWYPRRIYMESLIDSQHVYLLNESREAVEPTFQLSDFSGRFPEDDTVMLIQRALQHPDTGETDWQTVQGDFFGATGQFPAQLRYNARHRLVLLNTRTGDRLNRRQYTPTTSELQEVRVTSQQDIELETLESLISIGPSTRSLVAQNDAIVTASATSRSTGIQSWETTVTYENSDGATTTLFQQTESGDGELKPALNLSGRAGGRVTVTVNYTVDDGTSGSKTATFRVAESYENQYSLLSVLGSVPTLLPDQHVEGATAFLAVVVTILGTAAVASMVRASTEAVGLIAIAFVAGFWVLGWLPRETMFIAFIGWVAIAGLRRGV